MPIFEIRALPQEDPFDSGAVMKKLCTTVAEATHIAPDKMWASWHEMPPGRDEHEWESGDPIVRVISFEGENDALIEQMLDAAARVVAEGLHIEPRQVCVTYEEAQSGRISSHSF